ncbi:apolipoprotein N-acyltransferase [Fibrella aquatilis]|uniref:Apolipoprotein N-acyltransferase n=1 Tax=Fibrella aquatilis TaxID=2817059 RepID=A0A939G654_9BACT|nr:apolipoprotein N-acyltransferase [Fibrella aquatilis]MBO0933117.1 apolipoprotein N-acyltransferase [Fibrella aquatilis]
MSLPKHIPAWLISGLLYGLAWPAFPVETGWLAWFALVPLLLRIRTVRSFGEYVRVTLPAFLVALPFVCWWLSYFSRWAMPMIWLTQGPFIWVPVALLYPVQQRIGWRSALLLLPLFWAFWEWAWLYVCDFDLAVGGPGTTQCTGLWVNQFADLTGVWGLIFWAIGFNVLLARIIDQTEMRSLRQVVGRLAGASALWLAGPMLYSAVVLNVPTLVVKPSGPAVRVGLVQTNEDSYAPTTEASKETILRRLIALGTKAAKQKPDIIVAPEGAFPLPLLRDSALFAGMRQYVQYYNVPFATGLMTPTDSAHYYNEAFVFTPELSRVYEPMLLRPQDLQVYRKQHSLAFGEASPWLLRWADPWLRPGKPSVTLGETPYAFTFTDQKQNARKIAIAICWEQLYPATIAKLTSEGDERSPTELLTFIMNDGWFYDSPGPRILLALTQLRAIENRRSIARCANQGYSGYVDPFGRVVALLPRQCEAVGDISVQTNAKLSFFTRHPDWFPITCGLLCVVLGVVNLRRKQAIPRFKVQSIKPLMNIHNP